MSRLQKILILFVFLLAGFLRFWRLSAVPDGFFVDEANIGYNAYSILKTGRDEWGNFLPLYFRSTGDYKLPVYFYLTIPSILVFGLNEFGVRFLSAFCGTGAVIVTFFLAKTLALKIFTEKKSIWIGIFSSLFLAVTPWHVHFSRNALESNVSLFFVVLGFYFLLRKKASKWGYFFLGFSFFTYLAPRVFVPVLSLALIVFYPRQRKKWLTSFLVFVLLFLSLFLNIKTLNRAKGISLLHPFALSEFNSMLYEKLMEHGENYQLFRTIHNKVVEFPLRIARQYLNHFSPEFLFFTGETFNPRFSIPFMGNFLLFELPFFLFGLYWLISKKQWFLALWLFISPIVSSLSFQSPSTVRAIFMMPAFQIISGFGLLFLFSSVRKKYYIRRFLLATCCLLLVANIIYFLDNYFVHQLKHEPYWWNHDFKKVALKAKELEPDYDEIVVGEEGATSAHILFFQKIDPQGIWNKIERRQPDDFGFEPPKRLGKYYFDPQCNPGDASKDKTLYICKEDITEENSKILDKIYYKDNSLNFVFFENK